MKNQYEIKVQTLKKRSKINPKSIPNSDRNFRSFFLRLWTKNHSSLTPKSVQEPPKIDPETPLEPPRHHPGTKSLPKTSQEPPQTSQWPSQERFRITFSSKNEFPNDNFRAESFQFPNLSVLTKKQQTISNSIFDDFWHLPPISNLHPLTFNVYLRRT